MIEQRLAGLETHSHAGAIDFDEDVVAHETREIEQHHRLHFVRQRSSGTRRARRERVERHVRFEDLHQSTALYAPIALAALAGHHARNERRQITSTPRELFAKEVAM